MTTPAQSLLLDQIPASEWPSLSRALRNAYRAAAELQRDTPFLNTPVAINQHGRLVAWAVDHGIENLVKTGALSKAQSFEYADHNRPTGRYLRVRLSESWLTMSLVSTPGTHPRRVGYRDNLNLANQFELFHETSEGLESSDKLPHLLALHGHQTPDFLHLTVPSASQKVGFEYRTVNLMGLPYDLKSDDARPPMEDTDNALDETELLKDNLKRRLRDNEG